MVFANLVKNAGKCILKQFVSKETETESFSHANDDKEINSIEINSKCKKKPPRKRYCKRGKLRADIDELELKVRDK